MDMARQKYLPKINQLPRERRALFNHWRVQTLKNIWIGLESQTYELFNLPVAFFVVALQLFRNTSESPVQVSRWQIEPTPVCVGISMIKAECS